MKESKITNYDELPLFLSAKLVAQTLGVGRATAYELMIKRLPGHPRRKPHRGAQGKIPSVGRAADGRCQVKYQRWPKRDTDKCYFKMPNEVFCLDLGHKEISIYAYLLRCEDRDTYQCHPSYRTIGKAVKMCENTVRKYVLSLEEKGLIRTEPTTITTKDGRIRNGSLRYTIRPIQEALEIFYQRQLTRAAEEAEKAQLRKRLEQLNKQNHINETEGVSA